MFGTLDDILTPEETEILFKYRSMVERERKITIDIRDTLMLLILEKGEELKKQYENQGDGRVIPAES